MILVADAFSRVAHLLAPVADDRMRAVRESWPGPHTWVFPVSPACPAWLTGDRGTLAVRVSAHPLVRALSAAFEGALVSTSANRSGMPAPRTLAEVEPGLRAAVDAVVEGETAHLSRPTVIRDVLTGELLRD
nr:Sua5/YciO/YrdC/YwlC family protein [Pseudofulvimonas gallinarii]